MLSKALLHIKRKLSEQLANVIALHEQGCLDQAFDAMIDIMRLKSTRIEMKEVFLEAHIEHARLYIDIDDFAAAKESILTALELSLCTHARNTFVTHMLYDTTRIVITTIDGVDGFIELMQEYLKRGEIHYYVNFCSRAQVQAQIGDVLFGEERFDEALNRYEQAMEEVHNGIRTCPELRTFIFTEEKEHRWTFTLVTKVYRCYFNLGNHRLAALYLRDLESLYRQSDAIDAQEYWITCNNLSVNALIRGNLTEAMLYAVRSFVVARWELTDNERQRHVARSHIAELYKVTSMN